MGHRKDEIEKLEAERLAAAPAYASAFYRQALGRMVREGGSGEIHEMHKATLAALDEPTSVGILDDPFGPPTAGVIAFGADRMLRHRATRDALLDLAADEGAATDAGGREAEDRMDAYEALLDAGVRSIVVLCRAATRRLTGEFYSAAASFLRDRGGLTTLRQKGARKIVKGWCEGGRQSTVPRHCWMLLLGELPASNLKVRLGEIGGAP